METLFKYQSPLRGSKKLANQHPRLAEPRLGLSAPRCSAAGSLCLQGRRIFKTKYILPLLLLLIAPPVAHAETKARKESFVSGNKKHSYYLYLPENLKNPAPLIILLHGSNRDGMSLVEKWQDLAAKEQIILAGLNSLDS